MWDRNWGRQSETPEWYWQPWLGAEFGISPSDMGGMTPHQLDACREQHEKRQAPPGVEVMGG